MMPWGGYVLTPYESEPVGGPAGDRWIIQPIEFCGARSPPRLRPSPTASSDDLKIRQAYIDDAGSSTARAIPGGVTRYELKQNAIERLSITCAHPEPARQRLTSPWTLLGIALAVVITLVLIFPGRGILTTTDHRAAGPTRSA